MDKKIVYLTGFMGSGKSTIGPILANTLGWQFFDLDTVIEDKSGMKIKEIFDLYGEDHFRALERKTLLEIAENIRTIVALGGGTIANDNNLKLLKKTGFIFYLKLSPLSAYKRLKYKRDRPVLLSEMGESYTKEELLKRINILYEKRKIFYEQSDFIIDTDNIPVGKTVDRIVKIINHEIILSDGGIHYLELSASLIRDAGGDPVGIRGIARDVTERKKMESEQERFRTFFENIEDGCWEIDLKGHCTFCNKAVLDQFGYNEEDVKRITSRDYTTPEERKRIHGIYQEMFRTGKPIKVHDQEIIRKDGSIRILEVSASVIRDASGTIIESIPGSSFIYPNQVKYLLAPNYTPVTASYRSLDVSNVQWVTSSSMGALPQFAFTNLQAQTGPATVSVSGQMTNDDVASFSAVFVIAVFKDANGNPLGASQTEIDRVAPNAAENFSVIYPAVPGINPANNELEAYGLRTGM